MAVKTVICFYLFCLWLQVQAQQDVVLTSSSGEPCFGQAVTLTCTHPDPFQDSAKYQPEFSAWTENGTRLDFTLPATVDRFTRTRLNSTASTLSFAVTEEYLANRVVIFSCFLVLTGGGGRQESNRITIDVEARPPTLVSKPNSTSGLLQWNSPSSNCSNYQYIFTLTWVRIGDGSTGTVSTTENRYDFTGGNYTVNITAKIVGLNLKESEPLSVKLTVPVTGGRTGIYIGAGVGAGVGVGVGVVLILTVAIGVIIGVICYCWSKRKRVSQSSHTDPESCKPTNKKQETEIELGQTRQELDKKQEAENQIQYADLTFSHQRPIAPPSLETVVYTETVEQEFRDARKNRPLPPLPPAKTQKEEEEKEKQLAQEAAEITAEFKAQIVAILQASKLVYHSLDPEEPVVGTYQDKTFVANFVHAPGGKEIPASEVKAIIKARELQSTDKGFLVATTDSSSGPWLDYLEKHNCHFIGLSCKGGVKKEMLLRKLSFYFTESSQSF